MVTENKQLVLDVGLPEDSTFEGFYPGHNQQALSALQQLLAGQGEWLVYLHGLEGSGRSHLLQASCRAAMEANQTAAYVPLQEFSAYPPEAIDGLESMSLVALDDVQEIAGNRAWEQRVFTLFNAISDRGGRLLLSASSRAEDIGLVIPDLVSRFNWGLTHQLQVLNGEELEPAFRLRANQRGMRLDKAVARYLLSRSARDWDSLGAMLDALDKASLQHKRRLTLPFVKSVLEREVLLHQSSSSGF